MKSQNTSKVRCRADRLGIQGGLLFGGLLLGFLLLATPARATGIPAPVLRALSTAQIPAENVSIVVQAVEARQAQIAHRPRQVMNPASVMKLVTTYAALDLLGPAWVWKTSIWADADAVDGQLNGNLYIRGSGDPRLAIEHLWSLLRQVRTRGIRQVNGDIVLDHGVFALPAFDPGRFDDKPMRPYNVGPEGLLINFRAIRFTLRPGNGSPQIIQETPNENLLIDNRLQGATQECGNDWKDRIQTRLIAERDRQRLEFSGSYSLLCGERSLNLAPLPSEQHADGLIRSLWRELGGSLGGRVRSGPVAIASQRLVEHESEPLANAVRDINKFSNNVMARQLFLTLGNDTAPATIERARERMGAWLLGRGLNFPELVIDNGSGLSRSERISADSLNRLLLDAWQHPAMPEFIASLPIVGIDGTMKRRLKGSEVTGRAHIKTGTLEGVRTAAGYALDASGRRYAVTMLINHPKAQAGGAAIDALLLWLAQRTSSDLSSSARD